MSRVLIVAGLAAEAKIAAALRLRTVIGAGDTALTASLVRERVRPETALIVSFGIAGGLDPALRPGTLLVSHRVLARGQLYEGAAEAAAFLTKSLRAQDGIVLGAAFAVTTQRAKARGCAKGAAAVDLESGTVAAEAAELGLPFLVVRAIADPAARDLPPAALIPLLPTGRPNLRKILGSVFRKPRQIPPLIALARDTRQALTALRPAARALAGLRF